MSKMERLALMRASLNHVKNFYNYVWLILEIHMQKIIYISLILLCVNDVSVKQMVKLAWLNGIVKSFFTNLGLRDQSHLRYRSSGGDQFSTKHANNDDKRNGGCHSAADGHEDALSNKVHKSRELERHVYGTMIFEINDLAADTQIVHN